MKLNPNCEGDRCAYARGEVRLLPTGGDGNATLCLSCFQYEMSYRRQRNAELREQKTGTAYEIPRWQSLKIYNP
jgi:hypothetical protein